MRDSAGEGSSFAEPPVITAWGWLGRLGASVEGSGQACARGLSVAGTEGFGVGGGEGGGAEELGAAVQARRAFTAEPATVTQPRGAGDRSGLGGRSRHALPWSSGNTVSRRLVLRHAARQTSSETSVAQSSCPASLPLGPGATRGRFFPRRVAESATGGVATQMPFGIFVTSAQIPMVRASRVAKTHRACSRARPPRAAKGEGRGREAGRTDRGSAALTHLLPGLELLDDG